MRVRILALAAVAVVLGAIAASAAFARADKQFNGQVANDSSASIEFTVSGQGKNRKVHDLSIINVTRTCSGEDDPQRMGQLKARNSFKVNRKGKFAGRSVRSDPIERAATERRWFINIKGKLGKTGGASGTVEAHTSGDGLPRCYSGILKWKAKKQ